MRLLLHRFPAVGGLLLFALLCAALAAAESFRGHPASSGTAQSASQASFAHENILSASPIELWTSIYNGPANGPDDSGGVAVSPDGSRVFVTGGSVGVGTVDDWATLAYDANTGKQLWVTRFNGPGNGFDDPQAPPIVSPDGSRIYVTGHMDVGDTKIAMRTAAYDAADGSELWARSYVGPANMGDSPRALAIEPDGSRLFVTGWSDYPSPVFRKYATIAYDTDDGSQLWVAEYHGPGTGGETSAVTVSPGGSRVFVTGTSTGVGTHGDFATVAYDAADGSELWVARYNGPGNSQDQGRAIGISADGSRVFVTGDSFSGALDTTMDYATVAYDTTDGSQLWVSRYNGPANDQDWARELAVAGSRVFVTGASTGFAQPLQDFATVAYSATDGSELWVARYQGADTQSSFHSLPRAIAVNMDGTHVFVLGSSPGVGTSSDYVTVAYGTSDGEEVWIARYNGHNNSADTARNLALHGSKVYVTGSAGGPIGEIFGNNDYGTVAYQDQVGTPTPTPTPSGTPTPAPTPTATVCPPIVWSENFDKLPPGPIDICWFISTVDPDTPPNCAFTPDQDGISDCAIYFKGIHIPLTSAVLRFRNNFNTEFSDGIYWDGGVLEVSALNISGGVWLDITDSHVGGSFVTGGYTGEIDGTSGNPLAGRLAWSGDSGGYIDTVTNLGPNVAGQTIDLRLRFGSDGKIGAPGWRVDTMTITGGVCPTPTPATPSPTPTPTSSPSPIPTPSPAQLLNISTRLKVETGDGVMIAGFIISRNEPKKVALRGLGTAFCFEYPYCLEDPTLELRAPNGLLLVQNDNWQDDSAQAAELSALGLALPNPEESGIVATLQPQAYTAILAGKNQTDGLGLLEVYDVDQTANSQLANISTRGFVEMGSNVMIGGLILGSGSNAGIIIRGIGPALTQFGVSNVLLDPTLQLRGSNGALLVANDNWQDDPVSAGELTAHGLAPQNPNESGYFISLPPGQYTAILEGKNGGTGVGLVEIYNLQ